MTATDAQAGFLEAIIAEPERDDLRLIMADWLEDNGQSERARVIRLGIEEDAINSGCVTVLRKPCDGTRSEWCIRCRLICEARQLIGAFPAHPCWLGKPDPVLDTHPHRDVPSDGGVLLRAFGLGVEPITFAFHRGFPSSVTCPTAAWVGRRCERCDGAGRRTIRRTEVGPTTRVTACLDCRGSGRVGGHGAACTKAAPVTRVVLSDREPLRSHVQPERWGWWTYLRRDRELTAPHDLPECLWQSMKAERLGDERDYGWKVFLSREAALSALSDAAILWAKGVQP